MTNTLKDAERLIYIKTYQNYLDHFTCHNSHREQSKLFKAPRPNCSDARPVTSPGMFEAFVSLEARLEVASHS